MSQINDDNTKAKKPAGKMGKTEVTKPEAKKPAGTEPAVAAQTDSGSGVANLEVPRELTPEEVSAMVAAESKQQKSGSDDAVGVPSPAKDTEGDKSERKSEGDDVVVADTTNDTKDKVVGTFPLVTLRSIIITPAANVQLIFLAVS